GPLRQRVGRDAQVGKRQSGGLLKSRAINWLAGLQARIYAQPPNGKVSELRKPLICRGSDRLKRSRICSIPAKYGKRIASIVEQEKT
ncbi:MAG: hypothetical protein LC776_20360, partial [Acidobacteria bacterium]|nr:hypothetical protein [Acidobacteriota bacterium]